MANDVFVAGDRLAKGVFAEDEEEEHGEGGVSLPISVVLARLRFRSRMFRFYFRFRSIDRFCWGIRIKSLDGLSVCVALRFRVLFARGVWAWKREDGRARVCWLLCALSPWRRWSKALNEQFKVACCGPFGVGCVARNRTIGRGRCGRVPLRFVPVPLKMGSFQIPVENGLGASVWLHREEWEERALTLFESFGSIRGYLGDCDCPFVLAALCWTLWMWNVGDLRSVSRNGS